MVKPLNKEWALFGRKYRIPGAKGEKVDCNECHKQVSAAVNRLQSHLRVCPARPTLPPAIAAAVHRLPRSTSGSDLDDASAELVSDTGDAIAEATALGEAALASVGVGMLTTSIGNGGTPTPTPTVDSAGLPSAKRQKTSPTRSTSASAAAAAKRWNNGANADDFWLASAPSSEAAVYAKRRLEVEEKRLLLELQRNQREQKREQFQLEILQAQARREHIHTEKAAYDARVALALSRKQLRDHGVSEEEIDRLLPAEQLPSELGALTASATVTTTADTTDTDTANTNTDTNNHAEVANANDTNTTVALL